MALVRSVVPELLDSLAADDPSAMRSRQDLKRVHRAMGTRSILLRALAGFRIDRHARPLRILELGAGDGSLMLSVARALEPSWAPVELTLLDRQALLDPATVAAYARLGWVATSQVSDVHDWAATTIQANYSGAPSARWDLIVATLFLHHFDGEPLATLLSAVALDSERFIACEPRRSRATLLASQLIGTLGVNAVTRADAVASVRAGFAGTEITDLWPAPTTAWQSREYAAGRFSQCFVAARTTEAGA